MGFHGFLCDSMPTPLVGSRRFLLYDHLSVVSRRFYPSIMYIMSQSPPSYLRIDTLSPSASTGYEPGEQQSTQIHSSFIILFVCGVYFNCVIPFYGYENAFSKLVWKPPNPKPLLSFPALQNKPIWSQIEPFSQSE